MASQGHNPNTIKRYLPKDYLGSTGNQVNFADFYQWYQDNKEKELNNDCPRSREHLLLVPVKRKKCVKLIIPHATARILSCG
jgi:hypothetical protein